MSKYTKDAEIIRYIQRSLTDYEKGHLPELISKASAFINTYTGRSWRDIDALEDDEIAESVYYYDGNGKRELFIDDCIEISEIKVVDSLWTSIDFPDIEESDLDQFVLYPLNADYKNSIYLRTGYFPKGKANIQVTGKFVTGDLPPEIAAAAAALVGNVLKKMKTDNAEFSEERIEGYSYKRTELSQNADTRSILKDLDGWKKIQF